MKSDLIEFTVQFQHQTDRAVCIRQVEDGPDVWIPKSQCEIYPSDPMRGSTVEITLPESVAYQKDLI